MIRGRGHQAVVAGRVALSHLDGDPHTQPLVERIANRDVDIDLPVVPLQFGPAPACVQSPPPPYSRRVQKYKRVAKPLMVALSMIMTDELGDGLARET